MRLDVKSETYNRFLKRKELELYIEHPEEATPSMAAVQQLTAKQFGLDVDKTEVMEIFSALGSPASKSVVFVWDEKIVKDMSKKEEVKHAEDGAKEKPDAAKVAKEKKEEKSPEDAAKAAAE